ncbi:probable galacturonosyltransferase 7 isoform X2 [Telopea speciosissima]|uniref:probable galacturonosyltransferase 7 isoform X2 n=1 Tax=Telopea speciosissima TaxID=54955 RepID=UPI001CC474C2|nr:probable galacturonosyltransferase 7 isoform X2 [Telopea speciosissima]
MKGVGGGSLPAKRAWRGLGVAVLGLVILSMLVPLVFLLGLHNGFNSTGYVTDDRSPPSGFGRHDQLGLSKTHNQSEANQSAHLGDIMRRLGPALSKDIGNHIKEAEDETNSRGSTQVTAIGKNGLPASPEIVLKQPPDAKNRKFDGSVEATEYVKGVIAAESEKSCQQEFGSYCIWSQEHKQEMNDSVVKKMKDQLFVARAYYPSVAKLPAHDTLSRGLKENIQEFEHVLSETTTDADLPPYIRKRLQKMESTITKAKAIVVDCNNVDKKLRQILDLAEDEAHFHMKQSAFLYHLAAQTMPKSHHCLSMRLTVEHLRSPSLDKDFSAAEKYVNPALHHYVILSNNILASSVVINSTVMQANESKSKVFHVLTDGQNYYAMKLWFSRNFYKEATIRVLNIEDLNLHNHDTPLLHLSLPEEFRISFRSDSKSLKTQLRTAYISVFGHSHFLLPEIFKNLKKVVVLDDDVVVQRDLSPLWSLDMEGKVNGAVQFCTVRLGQLKQALGEKSFDRNSCTWLSGLNIIDLVRWRELNLTEIYRRLLQDQHSIKEESLRAQLLPASLLTFQNLVYPLDGSWALSGLGHDYNIDSQAIRNAAVLHYNGNMKPWLDLGIPKYKRHWKKFLKREDQFMGECNVNP